LGVKPTTQFIDVRRRRVNVTNSRVGEGTSTGLGDGVGGLWGLEEVGGG